MVCTRPSFIYHLTDTKTSILWAFLRHLLIIELFVWPQGKVYRVAESRMRNNDKKMFPKLLSDVGNLWWRMIQSERAELQDVLAFVIVYIDLWLLLIKNNLASQRCRSKSYGIHPMEILTYPLHKWTIVQISNGMFPNDDVHYDSLPEVWLTHITGGETILHIILRLWHGESPVSGSESPDFFRINLTSTS